jgi:hypothetical protein
MSNKTISGKKHHLSSKQHTTTMKQTHACVLLFLLIQLLSQQCVYCQKNLVSLFTKYNSETYPLTYIKDKKDAVLKYAMVHPLTRRVVTLHTIDKQGEQTILCMQYTMSATQYVSPILSYDFAFKMPLSSVSKLEDAEVKFGYFNQYDSSIFSFVVFRGNQAPSILSFYTSGSKYKEEKHIENWESVKGVVSYDFDIDSNYLYISRKLAPQNGLTTFIITKVELTNGTVNDIMVLKDKKVGSSDAMIYCIDGYSLMIYNDDHNIPVACAIKNSKTPSECTQLSVQGNIIPTNDTLQNTTDESVAYIFFANKATETVTLVALSVIDGKVVTSKYELVNTKLF